MKQIEPGCLALIIATSRSPHLVGTVVEVIEWVAPGSTYTSLAGRRRLRSLDSGAWHVDFPGHDSGTILPQHLIRIDGGEEGGGESQQAEAELEVAV